jgi:hypothetical protein
MRIAGRRPRFDEKGPEAKAPNSPPSMKIEDIVANEASSMGIQWGMKPETASSSFGL